MAVFVTECIYVDDRKIRGESYEKHPEGKFRNEGKEQIVLNVYVKLMENYEGVLAETIVKLTAECIGVSKLYAVNLREEFKENA